MQQYLELLQHIVVRGVLKPTRTREEGTGKELSAISVFGYQMRVDLADGFPLLTTKRLPFRLIAGELLWILSGQTNIRPLALQKNSIWTDWPHKVYVERTGDRISPEQFEMRIAEDAAFAEKWGDLGPVYGKQWRRWESPDGTCIDQIRNLVDDIRKVKADPRASEARRLMLSAWNVADLPRMALQPCHAFAQFSTDGHRLSCQLYQRSADVFLGVPFNIASYALLTHLLARSTGLDVGDFIHTFGDVHLYENHVEQAQLQLARSPRALPTLRIDPAVRDVDDARLEHLTVEGYEAAPTIKGKVAV